MKITKLSVEKLPIPVLGSESKVPQKYCYYYDDSLKGFGVRVSSNGGKSFFVEKRINRTLRRITLGRFGELTADNARRSALNLLGQIAVGVDPLAEKRVARAKAVTLKQVFDDYLHARKSLKPQTIHNYKGILRLAFEDWYHKPFASISKDQVIKRHELLGKQRGYARANLAMRLLRALFNFASAQYEDAEGKSLITENPTKRLSQTRAWYRVKRRESYIKAHELASWYQSVQEVGNATIRDYLLLVLFTGLRREEAASLKWEQIDFKAKTLKVLDTKNSEAHTLPLSDYLFELLSNRRAEAIGDYVFPGPGSKGYIIECRKQMIKITEATGISFTIHDLRRTFITIAESLDIPAYALKRLLNHKMNNDVTSGYIITDVERLRRPMQTISDFLLRCRE